MDTRRGIVCAEALQKIIRTLTCQGESRGIWIRATPRWKNKAVHFWYVHEIHCRGERYWQNEWWLYGAERPRRPLTDAINRPLQNRPFSMWRIRCACCLSSFPLSRYHPGTAIDEIKSRRLGRFGLEPIVC